VANEPKTILIVEDNELNMKLIVAVLELGQYRTLSASDAETALPLAREHHPDLILMDIQLPGLDGISATTLLKADNNLSHIPVVAVTGYGSDFEQYPGHTGFSGFITKPFEVLSFLEAISGYLEKVPESPSTKIVQGNKNGQS
jgi:two-component system cell cycle response regulator DivK